MLKLEFGKATISAKRAGPITYLMATGVCKDDGETYDFLQLPFFIYPPQWGFFVKIGGSTLKKDDSFSYTELIQYPPNVDFVHVKTESGSELVKIENVSLNFIPYAESETGIVGMFSVFNRIGTMEYMIAKADAILPAIYKHVFGPAAYEECEKYMKDHTGK
ncbi:hypothetical protein [Agrobacterium sp. NPDC090283]|uniref:hypothetical protein n=1 Tax=Agrobacterium sp. NPDC090283 TaxID=3363920 RepID=UPI00383A2BE0